MPYSFTATPFTNFHLPNGSAYRADGSGHVMANDQDFTAMLDAGCVPTNTKNILVDKTGNVTINAPLILSALPSSDPNVLNAVWKTDTGTLKISPSQADTGGGAPAADPSITSYRDRVTTTSTLGVTVRSIAMPPNSQLFLQLYVQYVGGTGCGFTTAQNQFVRGSDGVSAAGATDIRSVNSIPGFVVLTATATGVDILVKSPTSPVNWSLHTIADIG